ncbi:MAG: tyrosine-type recombinase/integrase [Chloroflexota bacterium]|nr:tyrosine-type recombinase/integrase [Chloroflexota bacterium]
MNEPRTPAKKKARELAKHLRGERPDHDYLKQVFRYLREELEVEPPREPKTLPYVPSEEEVRRYYKTVWEARRTGDVVLIKTLMYTGARVSELVNIQLADVDLDRCQIRINAGKGNKDRVVPFPVTFKEALALHSAEMSRKGAAYLFESSWKKRYSDRGVRKLMARYAEAAGLERPIPPHRLRHFLLTWLKKQGIDDALIQPYSGHASRQSLEIYSRLAIADAQEQYDRVMGGFPI